MLKLLLTLVVAPRSAVDTSAAASLAVAATSLTAVVTLAFTTAVLGAMTVQAAVARLTAPPVVFTP